jgi:hypothetical protein
MSGLHSTAEYSFQLPTRRNGPGAALIQIGRHSQNDKLVCEMDRDIDQAQELSGKAPYENQRFI